MAPDEWMAALGYDIWNRHARARVEALQWALAQDLLGALVELHVLHVPLEVLWERVSARRLEEESGSRPMTYEDLLQARDAFQVPTEAERALYDPPASE
jgi:predicted kinase